MTKTLFAAAVIAGSAAGAALSEDATFGPLPAIEVPRLVVPPPALRFRRLAAAGQEAPLEVKVDNPIFGVGQIFVGCTFDGQADRCLLDTGAAICLVTDDDFFGKYPSQGQRCTEGAGGKPICSDMIRVADLRVGGIAFGAEEAQRRTTGQACSGGPQLPGYLVGSVWRSLLGHQAALDFDAKTLAVDPPRSAPGAMGPMKLVLDDTFLVVPASIGGGAPVGLLVDTGAGASVLDQAFVDANPGAFKFLADSKIEDSSCQMIPVKVYRMKSVSVGGRALSGSLVVAMDMTGFRNAVGRDVVGILGFNAITKFNWWVDLRNGQFAVAPKGSAAAAALAVVAEAQDIPKVLKLRLPSLLR